MISAFCLQVKEKGGEQPYRRSPRGMKMCRGQDFSSKMPDGYNYWPQSTTLGATG